ncbi:calcium-binding protein [Cribrihabitans sp. XS_ASV171]
MDDFYAARSRLIPPLPWTTFSPPFSLAGGAGIDSYFGSAGDWNGGRIFDYEYGEQIFMVGGSLSDTDYLLRYESASDTTFLEYNPTPSATGFTSSILLNGEIDGEISVGSQDFFGTTYAEIVIELGAGNIGTPEADLLDFSAETSAVEIRGLAGDDTLIGGAGNDTLVGGDGDDSMQCGDGDDIFDNTPGNDTIIGGSGNDLVVDDATGVAQGTYTLIVDLDAGRKYAQEYPEVGPDTLLQIESYRSIGEIDVRASGNSDGNELHTGSGNDRLDGKEGNDTLSGGDGNDTIVGADGDDEIPGGDTEADLRDVVYGGAGNDSIDGGYGNDELRGDGDNDTISGGFGTDTVIGGSGNDVLTGEAWSDLLYGSDGSDFINGGFGYDRMNGGADGDRFFHLGVADHGSDWIQDYDASEGDVLVFGQSGATGADFQINITETANAGVAGTEEAFVIYRPTGQIMWALVDGSAQAEINMLVNGVEYDLLA